MITGRMIGMTVSEALRRLVAEPVALGADRGVGGGGGAPAICLERPAPQQALRGAFLTVIPIALIILLVFTTSLVHGCQAAGMLG